MGMVSPSGLQGAYEVYHDMIEVLEYNHKYKVNCLAEPQLGRRGLYPTVSRKGNYDAVKVMTNFIAYADGMNDLIDISNMIQTPLQELLPIINKLQEVRLISLLEEKEA